MKESKTTQLVICAFFAALSAVLSQIQIPLAPVPITLTHVSIFAAAGLLGAKYGTLSQLVFVLTGAAGIPVFAGFQGGMAVVAGPTGGFIIGYLACAFVTGFIIDRFGYSVKILIPAMCAGWIVTYAFGIPWFMHVTNMTLTASLIFMAGFLPGDLFKTILSAALIKRLRPVLR